MQEITDFLNLLELGSFTFREVVIKRITITRFGVKYGNDNDAGSCGIEVRADKAKLTNIA